MDSHPFSNPQAFLSCYLSFLNFFAFLFFGQRVVLRYTYIHHETHTFGNPGMPHIRRDKTQPISMELIKKSELPLVTKSMREMTHELESHCGQG